MEHLHNFRELFNYALSIVKVLMSNKTKLSRTNETAVAYIKVILRHRLDHTPETNKKTNSVVSFRKRTIPTERPLLVGEDSPNFRGEMVSSGQGNESPRMLISVF
jgi:hypothetical protein